MDQEIYLDNSATTKPYDEVVHAMVEMLTENYGNPSSLHIKGVNAERAVKKARESIALALGSGTKNNEVFFTSGGTESNNIAIRGTAHANKRKGNHLITTVIEHPSVLNTFKHLEEKGYRVSYIPVDRNGIIDLKVLDGEMCDDTILISVMHVNNEIGSIQPIADIKNLILQKKSKALLHVDAVQSFGKILFTPEKLGIDLLSVSSHKIHGPKGVGALYVKKGTLVKPIVFGGSQELNLRSGTENVPGIVGFGKAVELTFQNITKHVERLSGLRELLKEKISDTVENVVMNGEIKENQETHNNGTVPVYAPHILNVSFPGIKAEVLLHALESKGIYVSTGSACSSNKPAPSHVLQAIGATRECIDSAIRFSLSVLNTEDDIAYCVEQLDSIVKQLRKYARR